MHWLWIVHRPAPPSEDFFFWAPKDQSDKDGPGQRNRGLPARNGPDQIGLLTLLICPCVFPCVFLNLFRKQKTSPYRKTNL